MSEGGLACSGDAQEAAPGRRAARRCAAVGGLFVLVAGVSAVATAAYRGGPVATAGPEARAGSARSWTPEPVALAELAGSAARNWTREHVGFVKNIETGMCLDLRGEALRELNSSVVLSKCDYDAASSNQHWAIDVNAGYIRNLFTNGHCLGVVGSPGWKEGTPLEARRCNYGSDTTDQRWKFDSAGFIVSDLSGLCVGAHKAATSGLLRLQQCAFDERTSRQAWHFVGLAQVSAMQALAAGRPQEAVTADDHRRSAIRKSNAALLVLDDVMRASDPTVLLGGKFFQEVFALFHRMTPAWDSWDDLGRLWNLLAEAGTVQTGFGTMYLVNFLSNMAFAGMNFVSGFPRADLSYMGGFFNLTLLDFVGPEPRFGCHSGDLYRGYCLYPEPVEGEKMGLTTFQKFIEESYGAKLPNHTFFESLALGLRTPSWEDEVGHKHAFALVDAGVKAARARGVEPMNKVREMTGPRFAFDVEGLLPILENGFGWLKARDVKYASNGANGAAVLESLMKKYGGTRDVLGLLVTDSVLSMHLTYDDNLRSFVVDLTHLERYQAIEGYAPLGGRAHFVERDGRLATVHLEYAGVTYKEADFDDKGVEANYTKSRLSGWRFAEKAIIASLWAKTQLLVHVKTIHMELAPALQTVTVDALGTRHPLRRLLEPFIGRSVQAAKTNLRIWFEYRAGEFALAPLSVEEQLRLITDSIRSSPLNLADLDMGRYAQARGMSRFSQPRSMEVDYPKGEWVWRWHYRASKVEQLLDELIGCWLDTHYEGSDAKLGEDAPLVAWWSQLQANLPSLRVAARYSGDWLPAAATTTAPPAPTQPPQVSVHQAPLEPAPVAAATTEAFVPVTRVHVTETTTVTTPPPVLVPTAQPEATPAPPWETKEVQTSPETGLKSSEVDLWRRLEAAVGAEPEQAPLGVSARSLRRVLRTLVLWGSWIHEDVGHSAAALAYDPVHAPIFVPQDGLGIPLVPLVAASSALRSFVFVERAKLMDPMPAYMFDQKECHQVLFMSHCTDPLDDKRCFADFQAKLGQLGEQDAAFSRCDEHGWYSCVGRVESSPSS